LSERKFFTIRDRPAPPGKTPGCAVSIKLIRTAITRHSILSQLAHLGRVSMRMAALCVTAANFSYAQSDTSIKTLSTKPDYVTGGDVLVEVITPAVTATAFRVRVGKRDVTKSFRSTNTAHVHVGLIKGLPLGKSVIQSGDASLEITNYPITGPVISGPWQEPFICQTDQFKLPDGSTLGPPIDANCSAKSVVNYVYLPIGEKVFKPIRDLRSLPADIATTTISTGKTVRFIVRVETGTMDRGIYQSAILHDPDIDGPPSPFAPPAGWNRKLIAVHGFGCPGGWYVQGGAEGSNPIDRSQLAKGYALFTNTLNHPTNSCNVLVAAEATILGKEHFIETFGVPDWTISTGGSGGAYTTLQIADAFPGLFDGVMVALVFPDALALAMAGLDAHLLMHYYEKERPEPLTEEQEVAIGGYASLRAMTDAANQASRSDPIPDRQDIEGYKSAQWRAAVPTELRYDPAANPRGARPTIFDAAKNVYGTDPATGAALRPFDNVGVQYGLNAVNSGVITPAQFLDLNEAIGGIDSDGNYTPSRTTGDSGAIHRAYQSGLMLSGAGGLSEVPIVDNATSNEASSYHYGWFHFALRERLRQTDGTAANMVMWRSVPSGHEQEAIFDEWMDAWKADTSDALQRNKVIAARPAGAVDGCFAGTAFIADALPFSSKPVSPCSKLYPVYSNVRHEAGGPLAANVLKCYLKPVDPSQYSVSFTPAEVDRLHQVFPNGVCDFTKPGMYWSPVVPWPSFGPSPVNLVYDIRGKIKSAENFR